MLKRSLSLAALLLGVLFAVGAFFACGGYTTSSGAIVAVITTDFAVQDLSTIRVEVSQESSPGTYGAPLTAQDFPVTAENMFPATFTIRSGKQTDQNALIRVIGRKRDATGDKPLVLREVEVRVPTDRVLALPILLSRQCAGQLKVDGDRVVSACPVPHESCQPTTGVCGSSVIDDAILSPYVAPTAPTGTASSSGDAGGGPIGPDEKTIQSFTLAGVVGTISGGDIFVSLPPNTSRLGLKPRIAWRGAKIDPDPSVPQDFDQIVNYTVTAQNGTASAFAVHVVVSLPSSKQILAFDVPKGISYVPNQDGNYTIEVDVPYQYDVVHVTPTIAINGLSIDPPSGAMQDFTNTVNYTVTALDGSKLVWPVTLVVQPADAAKISSFSVNGVEGDIIVPVDPDPGTINVDLSSTPVDITMIKPVIKFIGTSVSPASGAVQDFTNPVTYTVTAVDNSVSKYIVKVTLPTISEVTFDPPPATGPYKTPQPLTLACSSPSAEIHYKDGTGAMDVLLTDPKYNGVLSLAKGNHTVSARCFSKLYAPRSQESFAIYIIP